LLFPAIVSGQMTDIQSVSSSGGAGNSWSQDVRLSGDARWVVFTSAANNLVSGDLGGSDIFIRDRSSVETKRLSTTASGSHAGGNHYRPDFSPDARFVAWDTDATGMFGVPTVGRQVIFRDRDTDADGLFDEPGQFSNELVSRNVLGNAPLVGASTQASMSGNGRFVAFTSESSDIVAGDVNGTSDVFLRDRVLDRTVCMSVGLNGFPASGGLSNAPSMSRNGTHVVFQSNATNLISADTNGTSDVFRYNIATGVVERVSVAWDGAQLMASSVVSTESTVGPCISADGRHVVFQSISNNMVGGDNNNAVDVFVRDMALATLTRVSLTSGLGEIGGISQSGTISAGGRFVIFSSAAAGIVPDDNNRSTDVFIHDRDPDADGVFDEPGTQTTRRVSVRTDGAEGTNSSFGGRVCDDGTCVAYASSSALVVGDQNGFPDVYFSELSMPGCTGDWDSNDAVDSDDVVGFFGDWNMGEADADYSGSTDSDDIVEFFVRWESGC